MRNNIELGTIIFGPRRSKQNRIKNIKSNERLFSFLFVREPQYSNLKMVAELVYTYKKASGLIDERFHWTKIGGDQSIWFTR